MDNGHCKRGFFHYPGYLKINIMDNGNYKKRPQMELGICQIRGGAQEKINS